MAKKNIYPRIEQDAKVARIAAASGMSAPSLKWFLTTPRCMTPVRARRIKRSLEDTVRRLSSVIRDIETEFLEK